MSASDVAHNQITIQSKLKNSFAYEYEMSTCGIYSKNWHLYKGADVFLLLC